ncbi:armadillo repeat-containing protein 2-like isoform X2 [Octopus sinensis]|uniref:Armadillo repeat-containing protein 2-like isoform X2 n=1 Tax=Octopus sinensis TaxID=2607531 RepID=A0A7E6FST2_9MOLL|nr:armadillo repeat-containing protein 2-like isoform X2 [Octopus sinensis]
MACLMEAKNSNQFPFYRNLEHRRTSADIIRDAKKTLRSLSTKRPFTPRDEKRTLFGEMSNRSREARPASTYSIGSRHFEGWESRPVSGTRLSPINNPPALNAESEPKFLPPKPPPEECKHSGHKNIRPHTKLVQPGSEGSEKVRRNKETRDGKDKTQASKRATSEHVVNEDEHINQDGSKQHLVNTDKINEEITEESSFFDLNINPLLDNLFYHKERKAADQICSTAESLYNLLEKENLFGRNYKQRSTILKAVFKLLDFDNADVLLSMAEIILAFRVTGKNLLSTCKLVFKVSRNEQNDPLFLKGHILAQLLQVVPISDPVSCSEALTYCVGTLKLLSGNSSIMKELVHRECIELLTSLLQSINLTDPSVPSANKEQLGHLLIQLTACLRNLVDASSSRQRLLACELIPALSTAMELNLDDGDLILNISRIYSKISLHTDCCTVLAAQRQHYPVALRALNKHITRQDVVVRICFALGNLTAKDDTARVQLFEEKNSLATILNVLQYHLDKFSTSDKTNQSHKANTQNFQMEESVDILIKTVRLIANLSIGETIGPIIAAEHDCVVQLLRILDSFSIDKEDLLVTTVATINNLSYYHSKTSGILAKQLDIAKYLVKLLLPNHMETLIEVSRVFGNLTHQKIVRDFLAEQKVQETFIELLDSDNREVVYISCGVLVNFMADKEKRPVLMQGGGIEKLIEVLRDFGPNDWQLAGIVCQVLLNYSHNIGPEHLYFGYQTTEQLVELLTEFLDEANVHGYITAKPEHTEQSSETTDEVQNLIMEKWENEFCPVAETLLQRLKYHQSVLEPLEVTKDHFPSSFKSTRS